MKTRNAKILISKTNVTFNLGITLRSPVCLDSFTKKIYLTSIA
ncbi:hypothetical protein GCM10008018_56040 [Paenibacillus marchantiophytorum]|uniref:Uncharacterized protein n=1 Tax=Paenibacillus marchantiophytorum TaxID=1619310 RepID=A0ABQ1F869_9BACL|nr:hypothetical protein GCM10008018_56040 [Paenibacillus marchantiophytorum]